MALIIDVETTGLPIRNGLKYGEFLPYDKLNLYDTSRVVQITLMLCNEKLEQVELKDFIIKADNFSINNSSFHGITNEISENKGVPFSEVVEVIKLYLPKVTHIIAHNLNFDISILYSELYRLNMHSVISDVKSKGMICSMKDTKNIVRSTNNYGIKDPSLKELYYFVFHKDMENAHNSKYDVINLHLSIKNLFDNNKLNYKFEFN